MDVLNKKPAKIAGFSIDPIKVTNLKPDYFFRNLVSRFKITEAIKLAVAPTIPSSIVRTISSELRCGTKLNTVPAAVPVLRDTSTAIVI